MPPANLFTKNTNKFRRPEIVTGNLEAAELRKVSFVDILEACQVERGLSFAFAQLNRSRKHPYPCPWSLETKAVNKPEKFYDLDLSAAFMRS
jgi:hypothetical protein